MTGIIKDMLYDVTDSDQLQFQHFEKPKNEFKDEIMSL